MNSLRLLNFHSTTLTSVKNFVHEHLDNYTCNTCQGFSRLNNENKYALLVPAFGFKLRGRRHSNDQIVIHDLTTYNRTRGIAGVSILRNMDIQMNCNHNTSNLHKTVHIGIDNEGKLDKLSIFTVSDNFKNMIVGGGIFDKIAANSKHRGSDIGGDVNTKLAIAGIVNKARYINDKYKTREFSNINNATWILRLITDDLIINDESNSMLYKTDSAGKQEASFNLLSNNISLAGPVRFCLHDDHVYVACYGAYNLDYHAGLCVFSTQSNGLQFIKSYSTNCLAADSNIHDINVFKPQNGSEFLIAIDLTQKCLFKISPTNMQDTFTKKTILHKFNTEMPRHFVQIPKTNSIAVITERPEVKIVILDYTGNKFEKKKAFNIGEHFITKESILQGITGAEIKFYKDHLYVTVRGYKIPYKDWKTPASNGVFIKFDVNLKMINYAIVGIDPRHFDIADNLAYIGNHLGELNPTDESIINPNIMIINVREMEKHKTLSWENLLTPPMFILLD